jgi:hypothetical protein
VLDAIKPLSFVSPTRELRGHSSFEGGHLPAIFHLKRRNTMHFTIDAPILLQTLKRINIHSNMHAFVQLQAQDGKLVLTSCTEPASQWSVQETPSMRVSDTLTESLTIEEDGRYNAQYQALIHIIQLFHGPVTLRKKEHMLIVESQGELKQQIPIEGTGYFPQAATLPVEGTTYTKKDTKWEDCPTCGSRRHAKEQVDLYEILTVFSQHACIRRECLLSLFNQIAWAVGTSYGCTGVYLKLSDGILSLQAHDRSSVVQCREPKTSGENWQQGVLIPATLFKRALHLLPKETDVHLEAVLTQHQHRKRDDEEIANAFPITRAEEIRLSAGDTHVTISLLNYGLPDYQAPFAEIRSTRLICSTADLFNACKAVGRLAKTHQSAIWLRIHEEMMSVETKPQSFPESALSQVPVVTKAGPDINIPLGWGYLPQALSAITTSQVVLELGGSRGGDRIAHDR